MLTASYQSGVPVHTNRLVSGSRQLVSQQFHRGCMMPVRIQPARICRMAENDGVYNGFSCLTIARQPETRLKGHNIRRSAIFTILYLSFLVPDAIISRPLEVQYFETIDRMPASAYAIAGQTDNVGMPFQFITRFIAMKQSSGTQSGWTG